MNNKSLRHLGIGIALLVTLPMSAAHATGGLTGFTFSGGAGPDGWRKTVSACLKTEPVPFNGTIVEAAIATPALSTLVTAVVAAGLADALSAPGHKTVFAPTNDAFAAIPKTDLAAILADPRGRLTDILTYHVTPGRNVDVRRGFRRPSLNTLNGQRLFLTHNSNQPPKVNNSTIACQGVSTSNGVVWVINSVLLPQYVAD